MAASAETLTQRIEKLRAALRSGVTSVTVDGTTTQLSPSSMRKELRRLEAELDTANGSPPRRPVVASIKLGGW